MFPLKALVHSHLGEGTSNPGCFISGLNRIPPKRCQVKILPKVALFVRSVGCSFKPLSLVGHRASTCTQTPLLKLKVHEHALPAASQHLGMQAYCLAACVHVCMYARVGVCVWLPMFIRLRQAGRRTSKRAERLTRTQGTFALFLAQRQVSCVTLYKSLILWCTSVVLPCKNFPSFQ